MSEHGRRPPLSTLYAAAAGEVPRHPALAGDRRADVAVIGGGLTGLSAALHLAGAGRSVVVLEAERIASGATGRNGGQLHPGQRRDQIWLERTVGEDVARRLWQLGEAAMRLVHELRETHAIECGWRAGLITACHTPHHVAAEHGYARHRAERYGVRGLEPLGREALAAAIGTSRYFGGVRDASGGHLDPYGFALGLARAAARAGARLHENSRAIGLDRTRAGWRVTTRRGTVRADEVVVATNGLGGRLVPEIAARVLPLDNYVVATAPLPETVFDRLIPGGEAVADTRNVVRYWRPTADRRLVFGGGETFGRRPPADIAAFVRPHLAEIYPDLAAAPIAYAWGGTLAVTRTRCPLIRRLAPGLAAGCGYSGHGIGTATFAGKVIADAIVKDSSALDVLARLPVPRFPGGALLRAPLLALAISWAALRDRLGR